jgi:hypothetical protein
VLLALATLDISPAHAHPANPPPPPDAPPRQVDPIPEDDEELYHSRVRRISPAIPGLTARILGGDDRIQVSWTGQPPLVIEGTQGEPMIRLSSDGVKVNERSPSVYLSGERYARVPIPAVVDAGAQPRWRPIESPGAFAWYEHRAHWMEAERPPIVGDGAEPKPIFHWQVPALLGDRPVVISGDLDWVPDPGAIRAERSESSGELLTAVLLLAAMALGAAAGVIFRRRVESPATA